MLWLVCVVALTVLGASPAWAQAPVITTRPLSKAVMEGQAVTLTVGVSDATGVSYQWIRNGKVIAGATSATLTLPSVTLADRGWYRVAVSNASGIATSVLRLEVGANNTSVVTWGAGVAVPSDLGQVLMLAASGWSTPVLALKPDGTVRTWDSAGYATAALPTGLTDVVGLTVGNGYSGNVAVKSDGTVIAWGSTNTVPAGLGQVVAVANGYSHSLALKADGTVVVWGSPYLSSSIPAGLHDVVAIAAGDTKCLALLADGTLAVWGGSGAAATVPRGLTDAVAIASGSNHNLVLRANGAVQAWGSDYSGSTVVPAGLGVATAIATGANHNLVLLADGTVAAFGYGYSGQTTVPAGLSQVTAITATANLSLALAAQAAPSVLTQPQGGASTVGDYVTLAVAAGGLTPLTYQWKKDGVALTNGGALSGAATANLVINGITAADGGSYTVDVTNSAGTVTSSAAVLTVKVPPVLTARPHSRVVTAGQPVSFSITATDPGAITYQWKHNGRPIAGATGATLSIASASFADRGYYEVLVSNGTAASTSVFMLTVSGGSTTGLTVAPSGGGYYFSDYGQMKIPAGLSDVVAVSAGIEHALALKADGTVVAWGLSYSGRTAVPAGLNDVVAIAAAEAYSVALKADGRLVAWGDQVTNYNLLPASLRGIVAISARQNNFLALKSDGTVFSVSHDAPADLTGVVAIANGAYHGLALKSDGTVVGWGTDGQTPPASLAAPAGLSGIVGIGAGWSQSLVLKDSGMVTGWGINTLWQLFVPRGLANVSALAGTVSASFAVLTDGTVAGWGDDTNKGISGMAGLGGVAAISCADYYSLAVVAPAAPVVNLPASQVANTGGTATLVAKATGYPIPTLQWRHNGAVIAGATSSTLTLTNVQAADAGDYTLTAVSTQGNVTSSALTLAVVPPIAISARTLAQLVPVGQPATVSITASGTGALTYQWRHNGVIMPGATASTYSIPSVTADDGGYYDVSITDAAGSTEHSVTYLNVPRSQGAVIGWGSFNSGAAALASLTDAVAVATGYNTGVALRANGTVVAWAGSNVPAGLSGVVAVATGDSHAIALKSDGTIVVWGGGGYSETNVPAGLNNVVAVAASGYSSLALRADGTVVTWGYGSTPNTALTDVVSIAVSAVSGSYLAVKADGTVTAWGGSDANNVPAACTDVAYVAAGGGSYLAVRRDGTLISWGNNTVAPPAGPVAPVAVALNAYFDYALKADGSIVSWGKPSNNYWPYDLTVPPGMPPAFGLTAGSTSIVALVPAPLSAPVITTQPLAQTVSYGGTATFTVAAAGTPVLTYQWMKNGSANGLGSTTNTLILNNVQESDAGTYSVRVRNGQGSVVSADAVLTVQKFAVSAQSTPVAGGSVTLTVNAPTATAYQWRYRGTILPGQTGATLTLNNLSRAQNGDYDVVLTLPGGIQTAFSYRLDVQPAATPNLYQADATFAPRLEQEGAGAIKAMVQLPDGKFLVGGDFTRLGATPAFYLARLNADGTVDGTFTPPVLSGAVRALGRQADGKIYVGGDFAFVNQQRSGSLVRLNADFSVDSSFAVGQGFDAPILAMALQDDGHVIVGGEFSYYGITSRGRLARLNADGSLDAKFTYASGTVRVIKVQADGKVLFAGGNPSTNSSSATGFITRVLATGDADGGWASGQYSHPYDYVAVYALAQQSDGRWLLGCRSESQSGAVLKRLTADGAPDGTFVFDPSLQANAYGVEMIVPVADGTIFVAGKGLPLSRLTATGARDATLPALPYDSASLAFASNENDGGLRFWGNMALTAGATPVTGYTVLAAAGSAFAPVTGSVPRGVAAIYDAQLVAPDRVLLRGSFTHVNDVARTGLVRLKTDGTVDTGFQAPPLPLTDTGRLALQGDGSILVHDGVSIIRLQSSGAGDATFARFTHVAGDALLDHDGKVLIANGGPGGYFGTTYGVLRLTQSGALDPAFSTVTGKVTSMVLQSNGRIVLGGQYGSVNGTSVNGLSRVMPDGSLDQSYAAPSNSGNYPLAPTGDDLLYVGPRRQTVSGLSDSTFTNYPGQTVALIYPLPDRKFLRASPPQANYQGIVAGQLGRHLLSGANDTAFAVDGIDGLESVISRLLLLDDGSLWVFGSRLSALGAPRTGLVRLAAATPLSITTQPVSTQAGLGGSTSFSIEVAGNGPFAYQWYKNGQKIAGATAATLTLSNLTQADVATYTVVVTGPFGSLTSAPAALTGLNPPPVIATQPSSQIATAGSAATFSVAATGAGSLTYQWRRSSFPIAGATGAIYTIPQASRTDAGIYDVVVSDGLSVTVSDGVKLDVAPRAYPGALQVDLGFSTQLESPSSTVNAIVPTGDGKFIVSGDFTRINGVARPGLARVDESFVVDETFAPPAFFADLGYGFADTSLTRVMAIQPDGKIMVTHALPTSSDGLQRNTLIRLLADGSVDPSFAASSELVNVAQLALQPDGRMIVIGGGNNVALPAGKTYVCRLMADGSMDTGYTPLFGTASAPVPPSCVTVQADGKALFSNSSGALVNGQTVGSIVRLTADGAVDPTFVLSGMQSVAASAMAVQPDGKLLIGGTIRVGSSFSYVYLVRLSADGAWEASPMSESYVYNAISKISIGPDGRIWVGAAYSGSWTVWGLAAPGVSEQKFTGSGSTTWWAMCPISGGRLLASASAGGAMRYAADTTLDGVQAQAMTSSGIRAYAPAAGGKFYVAGDFTQVGGIPSYHLARLNSDGTLDPSFAVGTNFYKAPVGSTGYEQMPYALLVLPDGRLLVGGNFVAYQQQAVPPFICLRPDGTLDPTFKVTDNVAPNSLALLRDGRVLVNSIAAYFSDGSRDTSFAPAVNPLFGAVSLPNGDVMVGSSTSVFTLRPDGTTRKTVNAGFGTFTGFGIQPDGKILLGGGTNTRITSSYYAVLPVVRRMTADLVADPDFVQSGLPTPLGTSSGYTGPQLLVQEDGRVILNDYYGFYRLAAGGEWDPSFALAGVRSITDYTVNRGFLLMQMQDDGSLLVGDAGVQVGGLQRRGLVRLVDTAAVIATQPVGQRVLIGEPLTLSVAARGSGGATFQWYRGGTPINGATQPTFTVASAAATDSGSYYATVANATGTVRSADATVYVTAQPAASQQITFPVIADHVYGDYAFAASATSDSGLGVKLVVVSGPASLSNGFVSLYGAGAVTLRASQAGNANFTPAADVERTFTVAKAPLTLSVSNATRPYGSSNLSYSTTASGLVNGDYFSTAFTTLPRTSTSIVLTSPVGTYPITFTGGISDNYTVTYVPGTVTITPATITATAVNQTRTYGAADPVFGITYSGFVNNETAAVITTAPTASAATATSPAGTYPITLSGGSAANYAFRYVSGTLSVTPAPLTATLANQTRPYGAANPLPVITYTGLVNNDTAAAVTTPPKVSTPATATSGLGTYPITMVGGTAPNYTLTLVNGSTLTITPAPLTVRADDKSRVYGAANPALTVSYTGFVNNETATIVTAPAVSTTATTGSPAGVYPITLIGGAAPNYMLTSVNGTLTVTPRDYSGTYFGTFASGGHWALRVRADNTATYLAYLPSRSSAIVVNLTVNADGTFTIAGTEIKGSDTAATRALALTSPEAPVTRTAAAAASFNLTGQIGPDGAITGQLTGLNETFSGAADATTGPAQASAGYYTANALGTATGSTYAIVSPTGQALVITTGASVDSASGTVDASGQLTVKTTANAALSLTINRSAQTVSAMVTPPGSSAPISYSGVPDTVTPVARVVNLSVRTNAGINDQTLIVGLVINGSGSKTLLARGVGPGIATAVPTALGDPKLRFLANSGTELEANNDWDAGLTTTFASLGASPLAAGSKDAAIYRAIPGGVYAFHVFPNDNKSGIALAELYDGDATAVPAEIVNISARTQVGTGDNILIAGFVITGNAPKTLLIRGVGPTLAGQGVTGALADPQLYLFGKAGPITSNDDWGGTAALKTAFATVGAGGLAADNSKDAALLVTLMPGVYSAQVSGVGGTTGVGLVEIFLMP